MGKQNLIILEENCTSNSFQALHNLQIPIQSFKAKMYAQICYVGTFKSFGTSKKIEIWEIWDKQKSGSALTAIFIFRFGNCFEENDDEVDGRSFFCFFSAVTSKLFSQLLLQRYSFIRAARFFLNSLYFFGSKYFLFSRSDLFLAASLISYSFPFSLGVIRENIALPRINCHTNLFGTVKTENLYRTTCSFLDRFYSNPSLFSPFLF